MSNKKETVIALMFLVVICLCMAGLLLEAMGK